MSGAGSLRREAIHTNKSPTPVGAYSQAIRVGDFVFISGQVPRTPDGVAQGQLPFEEQARLALNNLQSIAQQAGLSLHDAVKVTVYLRDPATQAKVFNIVYTDYVSPPLPARTLVQSHLNGFDVEVDAILVAR